jgi:hypothetical protein
MCFFFGRGEDDVLGWSFWIGLGWVGLNWDGVIRVMCHVYVYVVRCSTLNEHLRSSRANQLRGGLVGDLYGCRNRVPPRALISRG